MKKTGPNVTNENNHQELMKKYSTNVFHFPAALKSSAICTKLLSIIYPDQWIFIVPICWNHRPPSIDWRSDLCLRFDPKKPMLRPKDFPQPKPSKVIKRLVVYTHDPLPTLLDAACFPLSQSCANCQGPG